MLEADGYALAFDDPTIVIIDGKMPDERRNRVSIRVASVADFLVMKGFALAGREKPKDAYNIYFCVKNYPGGPSALAQVLRLKLRRGCARRASHAPRMLERSVVLNEVRELGRQQRIREGVLKQINRNPELKRAYDLLVKDLPEDQKETVIAQIGRTTRRAVARVQGQQQQQKAEGVGV